MSRFIEGGKRVRKDRAILLQTYLKRLASLSDSIKQRMSFSLTGPLTFLTIVLEVSSRNSTLTWVTPPLEPVLPRTLITFAKITGVLESCSEKNEQ